jgi:hypothetical protein
VELLGWLHRKEPAHRETIDVESAPCIEASLQEKGIE